jgi:cell pole-organizing protein PopZ
LLKDWLDKNLPATVDRLVQKEIERISRKVQD